MYIYIEFFIYNCVLILEVILNLASFRMSDLETFSCIFGMKNVKMPQPICSFEFVLEK